MDPNKIKPLGIMILALLREGDMHPYEMLRLIRHRGDDRLIKAQNGTCYHQVSVLERDGFIEEAGVESDGGRPERTTYTLRKPGVEAVNTWVRSRLARIDNESDYRIALAEAHVLPRDEVIQLLGERIEALTNRLNTQREALGAAISRQVDHQFLVEIFRDNALLAADIEWTTTARKQIQNPAFDWGAPSARHVEAKRLHGNNVPSDRKDANA